MFALRFVMTFFSRFAASWGSLGGSQSQFHSRNIPADGWEIEGWDREVALCNPQVPSQNERISIWGLFPSASPSTACVSFHISQCMLPKGRLASSSLRWLDQNVPKKPPWEPHRSSNASHLVRSHFYPRCPSESLASPLALAAPNNPQQCGSVW